jgi:hypothetical protein
VHKKIQILLSKEHPNKFGSTCPKSCLSAYHLKKLKISKNNQIKTQKNHPNKTRQNMSIKTVATKQLPTHVLENSINHDLLGIIEDKNIKPMQKSNHSIPSYRDPHEHPHRPDMPTHGALGPSSPSSSGSRAIPVQSFSSIPPREEPRAESPPPSPTPCA